MKTNTARRDYGAQHREETCDNPQYVLRTSKGEEVKRYRNKHAAIMRCGELGEAHEIYDTLSRKVICRAAAIT